MKEMIPIQKIIKELDDAWEQFIEKVAKLQERYDFLFKPANRDLFLNPICYKVEEICKTGKRKHQNFVLSFDSDRIKHKVDSCIEVLLDEKGREKSRKVFKMWKSHKT